MLVIKNFGLYPIQKQEDFFDSLLNDKSCFVSYYVPQKPEPADDEFMDLYFSGLIHTYNSCLPDIIKSCITYQLFMHSFEKNKYAPELILKDMEKLSELIESGNWSMLENDLKAQIAESLGLCFFADVDHKKSEYINSRKFCTNHLCFYDGSLHHDEYKATWYRYYNSNEIVSELHKHGRFEFLLTEETIEEYLLGFETYENAESFDLFVYARDDEKKYLKQFTEAGFDAEKSEYTLTSYTEIQ